MGDVEKKQSVRNSGVQAPVAPTALAALWLLADGWFEIGLASFVVGTLTSLLLYPWVAESVDRLRGRVRPSEELMERANAVAGVAFLVIYATVAVWAYPNYTHLLVWLGVGWMPAGLAAYLLRYPPLVTAEQRAWQEYSEEEIARYREYLDRSFTRGTEDRAKRDDLSQ